MGGTNQATRLLHGRGGDAGPTTHILVSDGPKNPQERRSSDNTLTA